MAASGRRPAPVSAFSPPHRSPLPGDAGGAAALSMGTGETAAAQQGDKPPQTGFGPGAGSHTAGTRPGAEDQDTQGRSPGADRRPPGHDRHPLQGPRRPCSVVRRGGALPPGRRRRARPNPPPPLRRAHQPDHEHRLSACPLQVTRARAHQQVPGVRNLLAAPGLDPKDAPESAASPAGTGSAAGTAAVTARPGHGMHAPERPAGRSASGTLVVKASRRQPARGPHAGRRAGAGPRDPGVLAGRRSAGPRTRPDSPYTLTGPGPLPRRLPGLVHRAPAGRGRGCGRWERAGAGLTHRRAHGARRWSSAARCGAPPACLAAGTGSAARRRAHLPPAPVAPRKPTGPTAPPSMPPPCLFLPLLRDRQGASS